MARRVSCASGATPANSPRLAAKALTSLWTIQPAAGPSAGTLTDVRDGFLTTYSLLSDPQSRPKPGEDGAEGDSSQPGDREFVTSGCDSAPLLGESDEPLHDLTNLVAVDVAPQWCDPAAVTLAASTPPATARTHRAQIATRDLGAEPDTRSPQPASPTEQVATRPTSWEPVAHMTPPGSVRPRPRASVCRPWTHHGPDVPRGTTDHAVARPRCPADRAGARSISALGTAERLRASDGAGRPFRRRR
jgi:hypothetical protein